MTTLSDMKPILVRPIMWLLSRRPRAAWIAVLGLVLGACSGTAGTSSPTASVITVGGGAALTPVIVNEEFGVGMNHLVFTVVDSTNTPVAAPDMPARVSFSQPGGSGVSIPATDAAFVWGILGSRGFYVTDVTFPSAGDWVATFQVGTGATAAPQAVQFQVKDKTSAIAIGDKAPSTDTPTLASVGGDPKKISSDPSPDPRFYQVSELAALAAHKPFVLVFATPAFCTSAQCGPTLDHVKTIAAAYPTVDFINVEPYKLQFTDGKLQPILDATGNLQATNVTDAWGILSEPWVYVVDKSGIVKASFPSVFSDQELKSAIDAVK